jgi:hypothetical protein
MSKSSNVAKVTVAGGGRPLCSVPDLHMLSHLESFSVGEVLAAAIISSLDDDDAASLSFARWCVYRLGDGVFFLIPNKICFISASSVRKLPLREIISFRISIIWSPSLERELVTVLISSYIFVCSILYNSRSLSISASFRLSLESPDIAPSGCSCLLLSPDVDAL